MYTSRDFRLYSWAERLAPLTPGALALTGLLAAGVAASGVVGGHSSNANAAASISAVAPARPAAATPDAGGGTPPVAAAAPDSASPTAAVTGPPAKADSLLSILPVVPAPVAGHPFAPTVVVSPVGSAASTPTGRVTVLDTATGNSCTFELPANSCQLPGAAAGRHELRASYDGDDNFRRAVATTDQALAPRPAPAEDAPRPAEQPRHAPAESGSHPAAPARQTEPPARSDNERAHPAPMAPSAPATTTPSPHATPSGTPSSKPATATPSAMPSATKPAAATPSPAGAGSSAAPAPMAGNAGCGALADQKQCAEVGNRATGAPKN
jgi:hypothetical protein